MSKLYEIVCKRRGDTEVVFRDTLPNAKQRLATLKQGNRKSKRSSGQTGTFTLRPAEDGEKFQKKHRHREH